MNRSIILIAHNLRSTHNIGSIIRTADGLGVDRVICTGYTPYPKQPNDTRLPHLAAKITRQIDKTALGATNHLTVSHAPDIEETIKSLRTEGYSIVAVEQGKNSIPLPEFTPPEKVALIVGREVEGIEPEILAATDVVVEIPMQGQKESYNVSVAAAIALYHCRFAP